MMSFTGCDFYEWCDSMWLWCLNGVLVVWGTWCEGVSRLRFDSLISIICSGKNWCCSITLTTLYITLQELPVKYAVKWASTKKIKSKNYIWQIMHACINDTQRNDTQPIADQCLEYYFAIHVIYLYACGCCQSGTTNRGGIERGPAFGA